MNEQVNLLLQNKLWAAEKLDDDPDYFHNLAKDQSPAYLWIGCADSRVPANEVIGAEPGELFVHRNIASMVIPDDLNLLSVLQYAVEELKVKHVIVCGHYGCGGVKASLSTRNFGLLGNWLQYIKNVYDENEEELLKIDLEENRLKRLVELNVKQQVLNLSKTKIIQNAWKDENRPFLHGWVYGLEDGIIKPAFEMEPGVSEAGN